MWLSSTVRELGGETLETRASGRDGSDDDRAPRNTADWAMAGAGNIALWVLPFHDDQTVPSKRINPRKAIAAPPIREPGNRIGKPFRRSPSAPGSGSRGSVAVAGGPRECRAAADTGARPRSPHAV